MTATSARSVSQVSQVSQSVRHHVLWRVELSQPGVLQRLFSSGALKWVWCEQIGQEAQESLVTTGHSAAEAGALWVQHLVPKERECEGVVV